VEVTRIIPRVFVMFKKSREENGLGLFWRDPLLLLESDGKERA